MVEKSDLQVGQKVHYQPKYFNPDEAENGIVKEIREHISSGVWVVYHCDDNWDRYQDYTSALTNIADLKLGWRK